MSYPPYQPPSAGNYPCYPGQYPPGGGNPNPNVLNYGFSAGLTGPSGPSPYPQPQIPSPYPDTSGHISAYPTASWGSAQPAGGLPYPAQPGQVGQPFSPYPAQAPSPAGLYYPGGQQSASPSLYPGLSSVPINSSQQVTGGSPYSYAAPTVQATVHPDHTANLSALQYQQQQGSYSYSAAQPHQVSQSHFSTALPQQQQKMAFYGTVKEFQPFLPEDDARTLRKAMKGFGTDEKAIVEVLANRTNNQRQQILVSYKTHYGRDLISDLKSELSGHLEDVILALMTPTARFLASHLRKAVSGIGTDEAAIIEILCSRSNREIQEINQAYYQMYGKPLEKDLIEDTSGHFRRLLVSTCMANRDESGVVDPGRAAQDAQALYSAGEGCWGTDESTFNSILVSQNYGQLRAVFAEYHKLTGKSIVNSIKSEFSGDIERGLLAVVKSVENAPAFFAERLYQSMAGAGTDDKTLIRIISTRCEIDLALIKQEFVRMFGKTLESFIAGDTSGDYKRVLLALVQ